MNIKAVKKHIIEEVGHGKAIQSVLNPPVPMMWGVGAEGEKALVPDEDWVKPDLPDWNIVVQWLKDDREFDAAYEQAFKYGAMYLADELLVLKDRLLQDPKSAPAYKTAMDAIRTSAMWRDPKYSERSIQEIKNTTPQDPTVVAARIKQLREELGIGGPVVDVVATEVKPKRSERMLAHLAKAREAAAAKRKKKDDTDPSADTP